MKFKAIALATMAFLAATSCQAKDQYTTDTSVLPKMAQMAISSHYANASVAQIKIDKDALSKAEYEVILSDGTEIDFNNDGSIDSVKAGRGTAVSDGLVPQPILDYVAAKYPGQKIIEMDFDKNGTEIKLSSNIELEFDNMDNFVRIDR